MSILKTLINTLINGWVILKLNKYDFKSRGKIKAKNFSILMFKNKRFYKLDLRF